MGMNHRRGQKPGVNEVRPLRFCSGAHFVLWLGSTRKKQVTRSRPGRVMTDLVVRQSPGKLKKWWWPGVVATSLAGAAVVAFRGCWHGKMGWPVAERGYSYQVCL